MVFVRLQLILLLFVVEIVLLDANASQDWVGITHWNFTDPALFGGRNCLLRVERGVLGSVGSSILLALGFNILEYVLLVHHHIEAVLLDVVLAFLEDFCFLV